MPPLPLLLSRLIDVYIFIILAGVVLSWFRLPDSNPLVQLIKQVTEPVYRAIRSIIPTQFGSIDLAPLLVIVALSLLQKLLY